MKTVNNESDVKVWAKEMFETMRGENNLELNVSDMKAVRELAVRRFGYMMFVMSEVADAFQEVTA